MKSSDGCFIHHARYNLRESFQQGIQLICLKSWNLANHLGSMNSYQGYNMNHIPCYKPRVDSMTNLSDLGQLCWLNGDLGHKFVTIPPQKIIMEHKNIERRFGEKMIFRISIFGWFFPAVNFPGCHHDSQKRNKWHSHWKIDLWKTMSCWQKDIIYNHFKRSCSPSFPAKPSADYADWGGRRNPYTCPKCHIARSMLKSMSAWKKSASRHNINALSVHFNSDSSALSYILQILPFSSSSSR